MVNLSFKSKVTTCPPHEPELEYVVVSSTLYCFVSGVIGNVVVLIRLKQVRGFQGIRGFEQTLRCTTATPEIFLSQLPKHYDSVGIELSTANLGYSSTACTRLYVQDIDRQLEIAIWPPKPQIGLVHIWSMELWQIRVKTQRLIWGRVWIRRAWLLCPNNCENGWQIEIELQSAVWR